jgi:hypothetical protein
MGTVQPRRPSPLLAFDSKPDQRIAASMIDDVCFQHSDHIT